MPSISWTKSGSVITASGDGRISFGPENKQLTIANVTRQDSGEYRCVANNSLGNDTSNAATLDVQCKLYVICLFIFMAVSGVLLVTAVKIHAFFLLCLLSGMLFRFRKRSNFGR